MYDILYPKNTSSPDLRSHQLFGADGFKDLRNATVEISNDCISRFCIKYINGCLSFIRINDIMMISCYVDITWYYFERSLNDCAWYCYQASLANRNCCCSRKGLLAMSAEVDFAGIWIPDPWVRWSFYEEYTYCVNPGWASWMSEASFNSNLTTCGKSSLAAMITEDFKPQTKFSFLGLR